MFGPTRTYFYWTDNEGRSFCGRTSGLFSAQGQLWVTRSTELGRAATKLLSMVHRSLHALACARRCDSSGSFSRVAAAWHVPAGAPTAQSGQWCRPRADFFNAVKKSYADYLYCRGLGLITADVYALRDSFQVPGTRVLQFASTAVKLSLPPSQLPSNARRIYRTHDNPTTRGWSKSCHPISGRTCRVTSNSPQRDSPRWLGI